jgi:hypothetical protein
MNQKLTFYASLVAATLALGACNVPTGVVPPPPKGITRFRLNVQLVEVEERNKKNERWDVGLTDEQMAPDLYYTVSVGNEPVYKSNTSDNKLITQWLEKSDPIDVAKGQKIVITFYDYDPSVARTGLLNNADDYVGALELTLDEFLKAVETGRELTAPGIKKCRLVAHNLYK